MKRFSKNELQKISELVDKGASLNVISSQMNRGKSSVQYQVAKLKGKKARAKKFRFSNLSVKELGWLIRCYAGDGSRNLRKNSYSYAVKFAFNVKKQSIAEFTEKLLCKCGVNIWRGLEENRLYVKCKNKTLYYFVEKHLSWDDTKKSKSVRLSDFSSYSNDFLFGFSVV